MRRVLFVMIMAIIPVILWGQKASELIYTDARELMLINQGFDNTEFYYSRLPADMKDVTRKAVWDLGLNSAGLAIRFSTNAKAIGARWTLLNNFNMAHMAGTGIRGIDLYFLDENDTWRFIGTAQPNGKESSNVFVRNMSGQMRDYMAYLPLYDGVTCLEIGVDSSAVIGMPRSNLLTKGSRKPILFYGTSITQGGCASRPGMVYTSIISRERQQEVINLGFSGNARMDKSMAETVARVDAEQYVIDCLPNCTTRILRDSAYFFLTYLAEKHPDKPIFMVENVIFSYALVDVKSRNDLIEKNEYWHQLYKRLRKEGYRNLRYIPAKNLTGKDYEGSVDGAHQTDLGFLRMAKTFLRYLKK